MQPRCPLARMTGLLFALMLPAAASAYEFDYLFEFGIEHNTNVNLSEDDPQSANILEPAFGFNVKQEGSTVQATANGLVQYRDYLTGDFSDDFRGQLAGHLNWTMVPERLNLTVEDYAGVQPINELQPNAPSNQQQTNVFAIGPTLNFRLGPTLRGEAQLLYINSYAEKTDEFNTNRGSAALRAIKDLSATSTISANVTDERVDYTEQGTAPNYSRYAVFGRYTEKWTKVDLTGDLGYSWLHYSDRLDDRDSPLARATLAWHYSDRSTFGLNGAYQYSDAASGMMVGADIPTIPTNIATGEATATSQPYLETDLAVTYAYTGDRLGFNVAPYYRKLDYSEADPTQIGLLGATQNQTGKGALAGLTYLLRPLLSTGLTVTGENLRYTDIDRTDKTWTIAAFLRQQWTRNWSWHVQLSHYDRNSTEPGQSSDQNVAYFAITYTR